MLSQKMQTAINDQINEEMFSAHLYLSMSAYFQKLNLLGFANWMHIQYQEETSHALKFFNYLYDRDSFVSLKAIAAPKTEWVSPRKAFEEALQHEQHITSCINKLVDIAISERDHATNNMLQWFVNEQVEEENSARTIVEKLKMFENAPQALYMLDKELGARVFVDATKTEK